MKRGVVIAILLLAAGAGYAAWRLNAGNGEAGKVYQGYVEADLVYAAPQDAGRIVKLAVAAGDAVKAGDPLFTLDTGVADAQRAEAQARVEQAQAQLDNLRAAVQRPEQIAVLQAQEARAKAQLALSTNELARQKTLLERNVTAQANYDQAKAAHDRDVAALEEVRRQIEAAQLRSRKGEIEAAEAALAAAKASLAQMDALLARRSVAASAGGQVQDVFYRAGEVVAAGQPVLSILPPGNRKLRFFVPEPYLSQFTIGRTVSLACDRCRPGLTGRVSFISKDAEYTPPVIFSQQERAKLVFRVEARPAPDVGLPLGLPVDISLPPADR